MVDWENLTSPELADSSALRAAQQEDVEDQGDRMQTDVDYSSSTGNAQETGSAEKLVETKENDFIAGGCVPEDDGEMQCKFNLGNMRKANITDGVPLGSKEVVLKDPSIEFDNVEQTSSRTSMASESQGRILVTDGDRQVFCESTEEMKSIQCSEVTPDSLGYKKKAGEEEFVTQKDNVVEDDIQRQVDASAVKFPEGGVVSPVRSRGMLLVKTEKVEF